MVAPLSPDQARLAVIREALPATGAGIYLNTAAAGPLPSETARAMADLAAIEAATGRGHPHDPLDTLERIGEARAALSAVLGADLGSTALTRGAAHGLTLALDALDGPADRTLLVLRGDGDAAPGWPIGGSARRDVTLLSVPAMDEGGSSMLEALLAQALERPDAPVAGVVVPLVSGSSGTTLPVDRIAAIAHASGVPVIADGADAVGAVPVDPAALGVDVLAFPAERWLLGPAGLGGLWCGQEMLDRIRTAHPLGFADSFTHGVEDAAWLPEAWSWPRPAITGLARSAGWLAMQVGLPWAWPRTAHLVRETIDELRAVPGVTVLTPPSRAAAIVTFTIAGWRARVALEELGARIFLIAGANNGLEALHLSLGPWTSESELDRVIQGVQLLASHTPATLPPRRSLDVLP